GCGDGQVVSARFEAAPCAYADEGVARHAFPLHDALEQERRVTDCLPSGELQVGCEGGHAVGEDRTVDGAGWRRRRVLVLHQGSPIPDGVREEGARSARAPRAHPRLRPTSTPSLPPSPEGAGPGMEAGHAREYTPSADRVAPCSAVVVARGLRQEHAD